MHGWLLHLMQLAGPLISDAIQLEKLPTLQMIGWTRCQSCQSGVGGGGSLCPSASGGHGASPEQSRNSWRASPLCFSPTGFSTDSLFNDFPSISCFVLLMGTNSTLDILGLPVFAVCC